MIFNSLQFILFFCAFFFILFSIPYSSRKYWLLIASCYFYMVFKPVYLLILFAVIIIDFISGIKIEESEKNKRAWLIVSLVSNIGILVFFKYFNFFNENVSVLLHFFGVHNPTPILDIILPIGLSFHTFQAMSYTIEVYRGNQPAERNILTYSLYVLYFPQLVAGPIERPQNLIHQLKNNITFNADNVLNGLFRMALGLFKKAVIADRLALFTDPVFNDMAHANGLTVLVTVFLFAFQIYCDFSGYTDIAIGVSKMMGISLMENFNTPFFSKSVGEFWRRWHISLSSWFYDYLFAPIALNKRHWGKFGIMFALFITFFLSGLWHGANWTFIIYGCLHGSAIILEMLTGKTRKKLSKKIPAIIYNNVSVLLTFLFACFTWIFFRSNSLNDALIAIDHLGHLSINNSIPKVFNSIEMAFVFLLIFMLLFSEKFLTRNFLTKRTQLILAICFTFLLCYLFGEFSFKRFIYFQF